MSPHQPLEDPIWHKTDTGREATFISPLYERLETNVPTVLLGYSDKPFASDVQLFPKYDILAKYQEEYAEEIKHLIHFETQVVQVTPKASAGNSWVVTTKDLQSGQISSRDYDAVVVASGHYNVPYVPAIEGIETWNKTYPGTISHSKFYDSPEGFRDKKVIVVGNLASGIDIGAQIVPVSKGRLIASVQSKSDIVLGPVTDRDEYPEIIEFLSPDTHNRGVRFKDGRIEEDIDAIVFCTGYLYSFPFLSSLNPPVVDDGKRTLNVYHHLFYIDNPTLVFPVVVQRGLPFQLSENQAAVFARVFSGRLSLPSKSEMRAWEASRIAKNGNGKEFHIIQFPEDAKYLNFLYDWALKASPRQGLENDGKGKLGVRWGEREKWVRERFPEIKRAFVSKGEKRHSIRSVQDLGFDFDQWKNRARI